ncbi:Lipocalin-like domain-containing protein [Chitinophaga sp. 180180018-2]|nr:Lipocalin-like domain-containing protein [Chitinophaga sp. 212800010-3]
MNFAFMAIVLGTILLSCKKEKSNEPECGISMTGLAGSYKLTALQYRATATTAPVDYLSSLDDCEKDDILILKSDGAYNYNDAGTVCTAEGANSHGTWHVTGNTITSDGTFNGTIASYDCKTLVFYKENAIVTGDRMTFTMVKQ